MTTPFINADMGEGIGLHSFGNDEALMPIVDAINVACGFHAGDPSVMDRTVALAKDHDILVGSHPGLPDLVGFGRRRMAVTPEEVEQLIRYQTGALCGFLNHHGMQLNHIKPHGALWGMLAGDRDLMTAAARVCLQFDAAFFGFGGTVHEEVCADMGVRFVPELYVDLNYASDGTLIIQRKPEMTDPEAARARVAQALRGGPVLSVDGTELQIEFDAVCVHSDAPNSPEVAAAVRGAITDFCSAN